MKVNHLCIIQSGVKSLTVEHRQASERGSDWDRRGPSLFGLLLGLGRAHSVRFVRQVFLQFNGVHAVVGLNALVQLGHQLAVLEVRQALVLVVNARGESHGLFQLAGVVDVEALVLEELDDGVFGQVELS